MIKTVFQLVMLTFTQPVSGFRYVIKTISAPTSVLLECLLLIAVLSTLLTSFTGYLAPSIIPSMIAPLVNSPVMFTAIQIIGMIILSGMLFGAGKLFSSTATFSDCLAATVWWQSMLSVIQASQVIIFLAIPGIAPFVDMVGLGLTAYLTTGCIKVVHNFRNGLFVFLGIVVVVVIIFVLLPTFLLVSSVSQVEGG